MNDQNNNFTNNQPPVNPYNYSPSATPDSEAKAPAPKDTNRGNAIKAFIFGIVALACCEAPLFSVIAIIFGALAKKGGSQILLENPVNPTRMFARLGNIFGLIGFIVGIVMTAFWAFYFIIYGVIIVALLGSGI